MRGISRASTVLVLLAASAAIAAPPAGIRLPELPAPTAPVFPGAVTKLAGDEWYVAESDVPVVVLASPEGVVNITEDSGPVKVKGKFVGGGGKVETRTFKGKQVFTVEAVATGRVELLFIPTGLKGAAEIVRVTIDVTAGQAPQPPPAPKPDDDPKPKPEPQPNTLADAAWVVVVLETAQKTPELAKLLDPSGDFRKSLVTRRIGYREYDKDSPDLKSKRYLDYSTQAGGLPFVLVLDKGGKVLRATKANAAELDKIAKGQ